MRFYDLKLLTCCIFTSFVGRIASYNTTDAAAVHTKASNKPDAHSLHCALPVVAHAVP